MTIDQRFVDRRVYQRKSRKLEHTSTISLGNSIRDLPTQSSPNPNPIDLSPLSPPVLRREVENRRREVVMMLRLSIGERFEPRRLMRIVEASRCCKVLRRIERGIRERASVVYPTERDGSRPIEERMNGQRRTRREGHKGDSRSDAKRSGARVAHRTDQPRSSPGADVGA
jgi:hypothetical protein